MDGATPLFMACNNTRISRGAGAGRKVLPMSPDRLVTYVPDRSLFLASHIREYSVMHLVEDAPCGPQ